MYYQKRRHIEVFMDRFIKIAMFCILATILGILAAAGIWLVLRIIELGTDALWLYLPKALGIDLRFGGQSTGVAFAYKIGICLAGGLLIGLWQKRFGPLPDTLEQVMDKVRSEGSYPYNRLHIIAVAAILPLVFGGSIGPEAGLSGLVAGLCCWAGDRLRYKGDQLAALAETGFAATVGVIFGSPLFGIVSNLEPGDDSEGYREKLAGKRTRIAIYCFGVLGAMVSFRLLNQVTGFSGGLPRFYPQHGVGIDQWKWFIPLMMVGLGTSIFYRYINVITHSLREKLADRVIISCLIPGACLGICGTLLPETMFSGETELGYLIDEWEFSSPSGMMICAAVKIMLISICINFGWRGGSIFPLIYSCALLGYSFAMITGMDGAFAVAALTAAMYGYTLRRPATVIAVLLLCFPITYIFPLGIAAIIASRIPTPFHRDL